jgi:hypothetical protein
MPRPVLTALHVLSLVLMSVISGLPAFALDLDPAAAALRLSPEQIAALDAATEDLRVAMGPNADLWQGTHADGKQDGRIR